MFFLLSTFFTLLSFGWFILDNLFRNWNYLPEILAVFASSLRRLNLSSFVHQVKKKLRKLRARSDVAAEDENEKKDDNLEVCAEKKPEEKPVLFRRFLRVTNEAQQKEEEEKKKKRKELDLNVTTLNRFMFAVVTFSMITSNLVIWLYLKFS
jgi:hypothetical protein